MSNGWPVVLPASRSRKPAAARSGIVSAAVFGMPAGSREEVSSRSPCPFWTRPITHVGLSHITTIPECVRVPTPAPLCSAGFAGEFDVTAFRSRFTSLRVSRSSGERASPRHLGERNCTSTAPKLSKTSAVLTPHPWHLCHFEGTDRSFPMYAAFPHADYYGGSVALDLAVGRRSHIPLVLDVVA